LTDRVGTSGAFWPDEVCRRLQRLPIREQAERVRAIVGASPGGAPPHEILLAHLKQLDEPARERALERLAADTARPTDAGRELLSWEEVEEMARGDIIDFESHGRTHAILPSLDEARCRAELEGARAALRARGLGRHDLLAYPSGAFDAVVADAARRCGHRAAFTTRPGFVCADRSHFSLPRILLHQDVSASRAELLYQVEIGALTG
jgi:peptidoglycan/xylan/chitin deacetylase (PgdA/CDA1 family)